MVLKPLLDDPAEAAICRLIDRQLDEAVAASGLGEPFRQVLLRKVCDMSLDGLYDVVETVTSTTPRTLDLVVRFGVGDGFRLALASATQDCLGIRTH